MRQKNYSKIFSKFLSPEKKTCIACKLNQTSSVSKENWINIFRFKRKLYTFASVINLIQDGPFLGLLLDEGMGSGEGFPKIYHTYHTMMKLGSIPDLKKIQKIYKSRDKPLHTSDISIFSSEISNSCYIKKYRYRLHFNASFLILLIFLSI